MTWMAERSREHEILDDHEPDQETTDKIYRFLAGANRYLWGTSATLARFETFSRHWAPGSRIRILDVASGAADIPRALVAWGRARGFDVHVTALDLSTRALVSARRFGAPDSHLHLVCGDVTRLPFPDRSFDYVTCALFFHHLGDDQIVTALRAFDALAARGIVVNDLVRDPRAWLWTTVFTLPFHPILRHDGPLSVKRALRPHELQRLGAQAGLPWLSVTRHFGHRMTLAGERTR